jgi:hypothetical protein
MGVVEVMGNCLVRDQDRNHVSKGICNGVVLKFPRKFVRESFLAIVSDLQSYQSKD